MAAYNATPGQMEVFTAAAQKAGFGDEITDVLNHGIGMDEEIRLGRAQAIVDFTRVIVCEGVTEPMEEPVVSMVTNGLIDLRFDQAEVDEVLEGYLELSKSNGFKSVMKEHGLDTYLTPRVLTIDHLISPSSHQIIVLRELASSAPELTGLKPAERWQQLLQLHPATQI